MSPDPSPIAPIHPDGGSARRILASFLSLVCFVALALALWPSLIGSILPRGETLDSITAAPARLGAFVVFLVAAVLRAIVGPGKARSRASLAWESFAAQTGGTFTEERRRPTAAGWAGGPTITWSVRGCPLKLSLATESRRGGATTTLGADRVLPRGFQFQVCEQNLVTQALMSPQLWEVVLAGVKHGADAEGKAGERARLAEQLGFLAGRDAVIGDPEFDSAFLLKTDDEAKARDFFADAGVRHGLRELARQSKGWTFSLLSGGGAEPHQLRLQGPGTVREVGALTAAHALMGAALERLDALCGAAGASRRIAS